MISGAGDSVCVLPISQPCFRGGHLIDCYIVLVGNYVVVMILKFGQTG